MTDSEVFIAPLKNLIHSGKLYPSVVLHGGLPTTRVAAAVDLARTLLCQEPAEARPCGSCTACVRIGVEDNSFHPDFHPLKRDRPTVTSTAAVRGWIAEAHLAPFEARAKVFVLLEAETLGADGADVLLKVLEEPPGRAARHFFLLTANERELSATIRSRSMSYYLGASDAQADQGEVVARLQQALGETGTQAVTSGVAARLAGAILASDDWKDPRSPAGWSRVAGALVRVGNESGLPWLLDLATDLVEAPRLRTRGIPAHRIVEACVAKQIQNMAK